MAPSSFLFNFKREFERIVLTSHSIASETPFPLVIMANYLNRLGFIDSINARIPCSPIHCKYSPGILAQLLVLVPFIPSHHRIALFSISRVYEKMNLELLTGHKTDPLTENEITPDELNDDMFGRFLENLHEYGCKKLFHDFAVTVRTTFSLPASYVLHSDTTSHVLYGEYRSDDENEVPALRVTYGHSKDKRNDLKQIMTGMVTDGDGLPLFSIPLDGNFSDSVWNEMMISLLHEVYGPEFTKHTYIADSKVVNKKNILRLVQGDFPIPFISRLPQNFHSKLSETMKYKAYEQNKWDYLGTCCAHTPDTHAAVYYASLIPVTVYGFDMYVHVYKTTEKRAKIEKMVAKEHSALTAELEDICKRKFFCEEDAACEMNLFLSSHSHLMIEAELEVVQEVERKRPRGRPGKNPKPLQEIIRWRIEKLGITRKSEKIEHEIEKASTFCLITNVDPAKQSSRETLLLYKGQGHVERQFSILKRPVMAATIFLKKPERIEALMTMIYFGVLLHGILQVISRIELEKEEKPPRWGKERRPLVRPTSDAMLEILEEFKVVWREEEIMIEAKNNEMAKDLSKILRVIRFDPAYM